MFDIILDVIIGGAGVTWLYGYAREKINEHKTPPPGEKRCTGYVHHYKTLPPTAKTDCRALRSDTCLDGRCSYHCDQMCGCMKPSSATLEELTRKQDSKVRAIK